MEKRKYLPTLSELIDRLSIAQLKEVFITEHKKEYAQEISDILYDIDLTLQENNAIMENKIQELAGGRKDYKIDCLAADFKDWEISWDDTTEDT